MKARKCFAAIAAIAAIATPALAQPQPAHPAQPGCPDRIVLAGESIDLGAAGHGHSLGVDSLHCLAGTWNAQLGASAFRVADSRWRIGRLGATARTAEGHVGWVAASAGSGRNPAGAFDYRKVASGLALRARDGLHARAELEHFDIDLNRGLVGKLGAVAVIGSTVALDLSFARSLDGNLPTRNATARVDWSVASSRLFGGLSHGRLPPQVQDIAGAARVPEASSRTRFAGVSFAMRGAEVVLAVDETRTPAVRRTTYALALQLPLP